MPALHDNDVNDIILIVKFFANSNWSCFPQVQLTKLSWVLWNSMTEYANGDERHSERFIYSKSVHTIGINTVLNSWDNFW